MNGVHAVIADTVEDFIAGVKGVLEGKERSRAMVDAAQQLLAKSNGPETVGRLLETLA